MASALTEKATQIKQWNQALCSRRGSGFHNADRGRADGRDVPNSPQNREDTSRPGCTLPPNSGHVVAFQNKWEHTFTGDCAAKVQTELKAASALTPSAELDARAIETAGEYSTKSLTTDGHLVIRNSQWNGIVQALAVRGVGITVAGESDPLTKPVELCKDDE